MKAYGVRVNGKLEDIIICAEDEASALALLEEQGEVEITPVADNIRPGLQIPNEKGVYRGVLWRWVRGPANSFGDPLGE